MALSPFLMEIIGLLAGMCTTLSFIPQAVQIIKTRNTSSISLIMYAVFVSGVFLWILYGLIIASTPVLLWNVITFLLAGTILTMKLRYG